MRIVVVGAGGFIGAAMVDEARRRGHKIGAISGQRVAHEGVIHLGSLARMDDLVPEVHRFAPDCIVNCAGSASVADSNADPAGDRTASVGIVDQIFQLIRRSGIRTALIHMSSAAVYGQPTRLPVREGDAPAPLSPYGWNRLEAENLIAQESCELSMPAVSLRIFSLFGEAQRRLLVWELAKQLLAGEDSIRIRGTGAETRDYLHVSDAMGLALMIVDRLVSDPVAPHRSVNIAGGREISVLELAMMLGNVAGREVMVDCAGVTDISQPTRWRADLTRLRSLVGEWRPPALSDSLARCYERWSIEEAVTLAGRARQIGELSRS